MDTACAVVLPVARESKPALKSVDLLQFQCQPHWGVLILPALGLAIWLGMGLFLASTLADTFRAFGQETRTGAPLLISSIFLASTFILSVFLWFSYRSRSIKLTRTKAILKTSLLLGRSSEINFAKVKMVTFRERVLGRLLHYGTVCIVGTDGARFPLRFIPNPHEFYQTLQSLLDSASHNRA